MSIFFNKKLTTPAPQTPKVYDNSNQTPLKFFKWTVDSHDFRLIGEPIEVIKVWSNKKCAIIADPETSILVKGPHGLKPQVAYVAAAIYRKDGEIYLVEFKPDLLAPLATWAERSKKDPTGPEGVDLAVTVTESMVVNNRTKQMEPRKKYAATVIMQTPFTEAEKAKIEAFNKSVKLERIYKKLSDNEAHVKLYGEPLEGHAMPEPKKPYNGGNRNDGPTGDSASAPTGTSQAPAGDQGKDDDIPF